MADSVWQAREELERKVRERTRALEDLKASEDALRVADRRKDEFLAMLAHELRNPLAPIRNAAQVLKLKNHSDPDVQWSRDVIERQVAQMSLLLDDLLDLSRISHNRLELRLERVDLRAVLKTAIETSRPLIDTGGHELTVILPSHRDRARGRSGPPGPGLLESPQQQRQVFGRSRATSASPRSGTAKRS